MTDRADLVDRLDELETQFGIAKTATVVVVGDGEEWPPGVDEQDITHHREAEGVDPAEPLLVEEPVVPIHRPPEFRGGVVVMTRADVARVFYSMPDSIREQELERRIEHGEPVPAVLQQ